MLKCINRICNIGDEIKKYAIHIHKMVKEQFAHMLLDNKFVATGVVLKNHC